MKVKSVLFLVCVFVPLLLPEGMCDDYAVFDELLSCATQYWCSNPCSGCNGVACNGDNRITSIYGDGKWLTCIPDSIGNLTALSVL